MAIFALMLALLGVAAPDWSGPEYAGVLADPQLDELSGLAASHAHPGIYWAHNDSSNDARSNDSVVFAIHADGSRVARFHVTGASNIDWEDIASFDLAGKHYFLISDTGDNGGVRKLLTLYLVEEPAVLHDGDNLPVTRVIRFRWPDGARDCEALAVDAARGEIFLIAKKRVPAELFRLPLRDANRTLTAELVATLPGIEQPSESERKEKTTHGRYRAQVTGADLSPDARQLAVLTYGGVTLYDRTGAETWQVALKAHPPTTLPLPWLPQAEAIAYSPDGKSLLIGGEQIPSPLIRYRQLH